MARDDYKSMTLDASDAALALYDDLFARNTRARGTAFLRWRYHSNPFRVAGCVNAASPTDGEGLAALYAVMGVPFRLGQEVFHAAQSLDTLTDKDHRRKGLFPFLAEANYAEVTTKGVKLVYGFPNANSYPVFHGKLGWSHLDPVPFLVRPLRAGYFLEKALGKVGLGSLAKWLDVPFPVRAMTSAGTDVRAMDAFDAQHDELWQDFVAKAGVCVERSSKYMNWRIFQRPDAEKYNVYGAYRGKSLVAEIIWCQERKHGGSIGYIMDCMFRTGEDTAARALMSHALCVMHRDRADVALAWNDRAHPNAQVYRTSGFRTLPERFRPIELHWGYRSFDPAVERLVDKRSNWYLSYLDSDTV